jgi:hypothetical protein
MFGVAMSVAGCEPTTIAEAREQLGRGGERDLTFAVPLVDTILQIQTLFDAESIALDTTSGGLLAVRLDPESLTVAVGEELEFDAVALDPLAVSFNAPALQVPPGTNITYGSSYDALASELRLQAVDTAVISIGTMMVTTQNRLPIALAYDVTLNGFTDFSGSALAGSGVVPAAPGDGSYVSDVLVLDLTGLTITPDAARVEFTSTATVGGAPIDPALGDEAIMQTATANFVVERLAGPLDPAQTPELAIQVEELQELPRDNVDFDDFEDAIRGATINDATVMLTIQNEADAPATSDDLSIGIVRLDAFGRAPRDGFGNLVYEADTSGPILVSVVDPQQSSVALARSSVTTLELQAAPLVNRLVELVLDDHRVALVAAGVVDVGDGAQSVISRGDQVRVLFDLAVGLDLTVPDSGVTFTRNSGQDGLLNLSTEDADQLADRVISASVAADVVNNTPFGVELEIAFVAGDLGEGVDVFSQPGRVVLNTVVVAAPALDAQGHVTDPATTFVELALGGTDVRQLLEERFTSALRVRLVPGSGAGGRGAVGAQDRLELDAQARIQVRAGGSR